MIVLSLGWGVQSFALAAMSALGELPRVDVAIHADTGWERFETMVFANRWTPWLEERGVRVVTLCTNGQCIEQWINTLAINIPAFTAYPDGRESGQMRRQCTHDWKLAPIKRWLQINRHQAPVEMWLGITRDEIGRVKPSTVKYIQNVYPFIELFDPPMSRNDVIHWLVSRGLEVPVKSGCIICPYHSRSTWRDIQQSGTGDWQRASAVDAAIRDKRSGYRCFLSSQRRPLVECDFSAPEDHGQMLMWEECSGMCFM
jgi:hypothetical protein